MEMSGQVTGVDVLNRKLTYMMGLLDSREVRDFTLEFAEEMADSIRDEVPVGPSRQVNGKWHAGGTMKNKGIVAKLFNRIGRSIAFVGIDYRYGAQAHLLEYGHLLVKGGKLGKGGTVIGNVPPHPFFENGYRPFTGRRYKERLEMALTMFLRRIRFGI